MRLLKMTILLAAMAIQAADALDVQLFRPTLGGERRGINHLAAEDADHSFYFSVTPTWTRNPIELGVSTDTKTDNVVSNLYTTHFGMTYQQSPRFFLTFDVPVAFYNQLELIGSSANSNQSNKLGDVLLSAGSRLLYNADQKTALTFAPFATLPTGDQNRFFGNQSYTYGAWISLSKYFHRQGSFAFSLGARFRERERIYNLDVGHEVLGRFLYRQLLVERWQLHYLVELFGSSTFNEIFQNEKQSPVELMMALEKTTHHQVSYALGFGRGVNNGYGSPDVRVFANATYKIGKSKPKPAPEPEPQPKPPVPVESPKVLNGLLVVTVQNELKEPISSEMTLGSGEFNMSHTGAQLEKALPPNTYLTTVTASGYYPVLINASVEANKKTPILIVLRKKLDGKLNLIGKILFDLNKANLRVEASTALQEVLTLMEKYPEIKKLKIEAHTDDRASFEYNMKLSGRRAQSVFDYLKEHGVAAERLVFEGKGESAPIASNKTEEGRAKNRRVDFIILETQEEQPKVQTYFPTELYNLE